MKKEKLLPAQCQKCHKKYPKFFIKCYGLLGFKPDNKLEEELTEDQLDLLEVIQNPVKWVETEFGVQPRWYQKEVLLCSGQKKTLRWGRRIGKTTVLCMKILHYSFINQDKTTLVIAPYQSQVEHMFGIMKQFMAKSPNVQSSVSRVTNSPYRIVFRNGCKVLGFTAGTKSGSHSTGIRGRDANFLVFDEADYLSLEDMAALTPILASDPDCLFWVSSTPTGKRDYFYRFCTDHTLGFKEVHHPSSVSPTWTKEIETFEKRIHSTSSYDHEFEGNFGEEAAGVFQNQYIEKCIKPYRLPALPYDNKSVLTMGVDWNAAKEGIHIVIVEWNEGLGKYRLLHKDIMKQVEFTQEKAVTRIINLNKKWIPDYIYCDAGYGESSIEMLHRYGVDHPSTGLAKKVKGIDFRKKVNIRDPATKRLVSKDLKPLMVNVAARFVEENKVILPQSEDVKNGLVGQMRDYYILRTGALGQPVYSDTNEDTLIAFMLAILAMFLEFSDALKANYTTRVAFGGPLGEGKKQKEEEPYRFEQSESRKKEELNKRLVVTPRWDNGSLFKARTLSDLGRSRVVKIFDSEKLGETDRRTERGSPLAISMRNLRKNRATPRRTNF